MIARLNTGGPARHVVWLNEGLPAEKFESVLLTGTVPPGEGDMSYFAERYGIKPHFIPEMSRELSPKDAVSLWKVYRRLLAEKPDIIHTHTAKAGTIGRVAGFFYRWLTPAALIGRPRRVVFIHTYHGHVFHSYYGKWKTGIFLAIEKALAFFATDRIFVLSEQQRWEINEKFGVGRAAQFRIVPLGLDLAPFRDWRARRDVLREELAAAPNEILVGLVGRLTEIKNHSLFLRVAKLWKERKTPDAQRVRFLVIGDGHLREPLEKEAADLNLTTDDLLFLGERSDPEIFYPALDVVALTSHNEGTPLSLIEAMANSRAIVSTAVGGVIDLLGAKSEKVADVEVGERGILVPANDAERFYQGLSLLITDKELREDFGRRGNEFVSAKYSKERLLADVERIYDEILAV